MEFYNQRLRLLWHYLLTYHIGTFLEVNNFMLGDNRCIKTTKLNHVTEIYLKNIIMLWLIQVAVCVKAHYTRVYKFNELADLFQAAFWNAFCWK